MKPDRLLQHFDQLAEAPDAVPHLRRFILDLAVRGMLVEQDPADEPAAELLKRIDAEKKRLAKAGEIRREKPLPSVDEDTTPITFTLPASWEWVPIRRIAPDRGQKIPNKEFSYVDVSAIDKERGIITEPQVLAPDGAPSRARKIVQKGDVIYSCVRPYLLNIAVVDKEFEPEPIVSTAFAVLNGLGLVLPRYLWIVLRSPYFVSCVEKKMRGQAYPAINDGDFAPLPVPLPPLAEQHRIVAKVDELMALCDELEAAQAKRERRRDRLVAATLHGLNNGDATADPGAHPTFQDSAHFYFNHLPRLTTRPERIHQLRKTILTLAVRGKLVRQDSKDEHASELLKRIYAKKEELISLSKLRRQQPPSPIEESDRVFAVHPGWQWVKIGDLALSTDYGTSFKSANIDDGVPVLKMGDIQGGQVCLGSHAKVPRDIDDLPVLFLKRYDLLYNRTNSAELVGKTGIYLGGDDEFTFASYLIRVRLMLELTIPRYVNLAMNASYFRETQIVPHLKQQCGQANVNGTMLRNMVIPLPPLAEQHRIVAKVDELMALCDELEARLTTTATTRRQLLETALHEALGGDT